MEKESAFKFVDDDLNQELVALLRKAKIEHCIDKDGVVHYPAETDETVENDLICAIRDRVFPAWQVLTCPSEWTGRYKEYMKRHHIPYTEELANGERWFLIPRKYRPHSWKLEETTRKAREQTKKRLARSV